MFTHGELVRLKFDKGYTEFEVEGRISMEDGVTCICTNESSLMGYPASEKFGYRYSYGIIDKSGLKVGAWDTIPLPVTLPPLPKGYGLKTPIRKSSLSTVKMPTLIKKLKTTKTITKIKPKMMIKLGSSYVDKQHLNIIRQCINLKESALLVGETGTGKTTILRELAKENGVPLTRISLNGSTGVEEIIGKWLAKDGSTYWQDGVLTKALKEGEWIVFDEINAALPEILFALHSLLDDEKKISLTEKDNEIVSPHDNFRFFATMNPSEDYAGTKDMNRALMSRFNAIIHIETLSESQEEEVIAQESKCDPKIATILVKIGKDLRQLKKTDILFYYCSTRDLVQAGRLVGGDIDLNDAIQVTVINKMSKDEAKVDTVQEVFRKYISMPIKSVVTYKEIEDGYEKMKEENKTLREELERKNNHIEKLSVDVVAQLNKLLIK